jgi:gluconate 2-dehydrogenase gamma chain
MRGPKPLNRRGFLAQILRTLAAGAASGPALRTAAAALESGARADPRTRLSAGQWQLLAAVQAHLLPSEPGIPGAREVNAAGYLRLVLADPGLGDDDRELMRAGVAELERLCRDLHQQEFTSLTERKREAVLRVLEKSPTGERWLGEMLDFLLEALLGDPSYAGNPGSIGWKWLGITPGFPLPPASRP